MSKFAFQPYGASHSSDDDVLAHHGEARRLQRHMQKAGHEAHIERGGDGDRVWIQHPEHKDTFSYVTRSHAENPSAEPYWVRK